MTAPNNKTGVLSVRRLALLATTVAGLSAGAYFIAPGVTFNTPAALAQNLSHEARAIATPVGFADIVEKVKPAVISVRVKAEAGPQLSINRELPFPKGSPMEQFFRRFGMPDGVPNAPRGRNFVSGQGSGFLISADGYAVTNNHVVAKATTVEVAFDDGKTGQAAADRRLGACGRQSVRPGRHRDRRHRLVARPRHRRRSVRRLHPDRRPGQQG
jgi:serine protease Do